MEASTQGEMKMEITKKQAVSALRNFVKTHHSLGKIRVSKDGEVNMFGTMPNTNQIGWFYAGTVKDAYNHYLGHIRPVNVV